MVTRYPDVLIRKGGYVSDTRIDEAKEALQRYANQMRYDLNVYANYTSSGNVKDDIDLYSWVNTVENVEDTLYNTGVLGNADVHVIVYDSGTGETAGAGRAFWDAGVPNDYYPDDGNQYYRDWETAVGRQYSFAFVNAQSALPPWNKGYMLNTVIHEVAHTFSCSHSDGGIYDNDKASPMATWYVESDESVYVSNPDYEDQGYFCIEEGDWDNTGHTTDITSCTLHNTEIHIEDYF